MNEEHICCSWNRTQTPRWMEETHEEQNIIAHGCRPCYAQWHSGKLRRVCCGIHRPGKTEILIFCFLSFIQKSGSVRTDTWGREIIQIINWSFISEIATFILHPPLFHSARKIWNYFQGGRIGCGYKMEILLPDPTEFYFQNTKNCLNIFEGLLYNFAVWRVFCFGEVFFMSRWFCLLPKNIWQNHDTFYQSRPGWS